MIQGPQPLPVSLRISVTDRCQVRCFYCMPPEGVPACDHADVLRFEQIVRFVRAVKDHLGLSKAHLTGGEPLVRAGIVDLVSMLAAEGVDDLALTTNGLRLGEMAGDLRAAGLNRVNVSLDSLAEHTFASLTGGGSLQDVLTGIETALAEGLTPVKLNVVVLKGVNDHEVVGLAEWGLQRGCWVRFLELMPIGFAQRQHKDLFVPASEIRKRLEQIFTLEPLAETCGASSRNFMATARDSAGRSGIIGFITPETEPFCRGCRRLRLTSTGRLIACLAQDHGAEIRELLGDAGPAAEQELKETVTHLLGLKGPRTSFPEDRVMSTVGG
ncbi:hypothetical protein LCGC14_0015520 [marine sediment metagenome]|uniref:Radical SAM core domain-containing protein n=1 Tax=marine sediment metagenome TaxID=412755 RepID=A0A0F9W173_9ZZZZ